MGLIEIANETIFFRERGKGKVGEGSQGTKRVLETFPFPLRGKKDASSRFCLVPESLERGKKIHRHCRTLIRSCTPTHIPTPIHTCTAIRNTALVPLLLLLQVLVDIQVTRIPILTHILTTDMRIHIPTRINFTQDNHNNRLPIRPADLRQLQRHRRKCKVLRVRLLQCRLPLLWVWALQRDLGRVHLRGRGNGREKGSREVLLCRLLRELLVGTGTEREREKEKGIETETEKVLADLLLHRHHISIGFIHNS